jgi:YggT family protein
MDILLVPVLLLIKTIIGIAIMVVVVDVVIGWLLGANILNSNNRIVHAAVYAIAKLSNMMLNPIRRNIPCIIGVLDLSPVVLILLLTFLENVVVRILIKLV